MGTCFPKSKCADLGRSLRKGASTTCLQTRSASTAAPALSQSRALDFVWLCLWHFRFRFSAWLRSCCWPLVLLGSEQDPAPAPAPVLLLLASHQRSQLCMHCLRCTALQNIPPVFTCLRKLWEEVLRWQTQLPPGTNRYCKWPEQAWEGGTWTPDHSKELDSVLGAMNFLALP